MPRYTLKSAAEADKQYASLSEDTRRLVDRRIQELLENSAGDPDKQYDAQTVDLGSGDPRSRYPQMRSRPARRRSFDPQHHAGLRVSLDT